MLNGLTFIGESKQTFKTGITCDEDIDGCAANPCGNRSCTDLTPMEQAVNGSQGYRCQCMPGEIDMGGLCLVPGIKCNKRYPLSRLLITTQSKQVAKNTTPFFKQQYNVTKPITKQRHLIDRGSLVLT